MDDFKIHFVTNQNLKNESQKVNLRNRKKDTCTQCPTSILKMIYCKKIRMVDPSFTFVPGSGDWRNTRSPLPLTSICKWTSC